jgi:hypothetical protein
MPFKSAIALRFRIAEDANNRSFRLPGIKSQQMNAISMMTFVSVVEKCQLIRRFDVLQWLHETDTVDAPFSGEMRREGGHRSICSLRHCFVTKQGHQSPGDITKNRPLLFAPCEDPKG